LLVCELRRIQNARCNDENYNLNELCKNISGVIK